jgi:hypothetical protein
MLLPLLAFAVLQARCRQKYVSPFVAAPAGYLIVEGYIAGNGPTQYTLSRTLALPGDSSVPAEEGARLQVEGDDNSVYPLIGQGKGVYAADTLPLKAATKYRLRINTSNGESYLSDFVPFKPTPAIDSISWTYDPSGIEIYANTHDAANATRYYQWQYTETWEYSSAEWSFFEYLPDTNPATIVLRDSANQIGRCWHSASSFSLFLGSSEQLVQDLIYQYPLQHIPANSQITSVLYSMLVTQYGLTEDAYKFLSIMEKNSGSLGSIFDAQPSQLKGNIHCVSNPGLQAIGFVSAGTFQQQRLFIASSQVPSTYFYNCAVPDIIIALAQDSLKKYFGYNPDMPSYTPILKHFTMGFQDGWIANRSDCVDCRLQGGTNQKPSFWPY